MNEFDLVIKRGHVVTASDDYMGDIGIKEGKVATIADEIKTGKEVIDAKGKYVFPGAVDIHTHLDASLHGSHTLDDWYQGTYTAAFGGVTCIVDYPSQEKGKGLRDVIEKTNNNAKSKAVIDYSFSPIIIERTKKVYEELPQLIEEGFPTYKVFMAYDFRIHDEELIELMDIISRNGGILGVHCENDWAIGYMTKKMIDEGKIAPKYHPISRPPLSEEEATGRVIRIAEMIDAPVLIVHVSAKGAVKEVANARARGVKVYAETCPHFLLLDEVLYNQPVEEAAKYVVTPPIRTEEHRKALWDGISSGIISLVSSDHCAFSIKEKLKLGRDVFAKIPHGAPGLETRIPLLFSEGVYKKRITANKFVEIVSTNPAKIAGLYPRKGTISPGSDADFMILDDSEEKRISIDTLKGVCDFTPFDGYQVHGWPKTVISKGKVVIMDGELVAEPGTGLLVKRNKFRAF